MKILSPKKIELLAPAKDLECGIEAINHGADAVYIGAPKFSARASAGNSIDDIRKLAAYAHLYSAKVYVALNTILKDEELKEAEQTIWGLYHSGVDAVIIQDMGILEMNLPPVAIHASTQADNRDPEKIKFLEKAGFSQIVLARELSLQQIKDIADKVTVPLEVFVHGALCVSYSGQCYISQAMCGRSANRGECAQYCRLPYTLQDAKGRTIVSNKHLLSLKDLNLSDSLEQLLDAGASSLKIEGRLKDISYVKNVTAYYRKKLDEIFARRPEYVPASAGKCTFSFIPDPAKSFNRGFTSYFLNGRQENIISEDTPKSIGELVGKVKDVEKNFLTITRKVELNNGDGLCFLNEKGEFQGFRVNRVEGNKVFPAEMPRITLHTLLYRNFNQSFEKQLSKKSSDRKIPLSITLEENNFGFTLSGETGDNCSASIAIPLTKELANKEQRQVIEQHLSKFGNTIFEVENISVDFGRNYFIPASVLSEMRRQLTEKLLIVRKIRYKQSYRHIVPNDYPYPEKSLSYTGNVSNVKARDFYRRHGVQQIDEAFELKKTEDAILMFSKHCLRYALGYCPHYQKGKAPLPEPLTLLNNHYKLKLEFDCKKCEMKLC